MSNLFKDFLFEDIVSKNKGFLRGPFGGSLKKEIFVPKGENTYKVYEQGVVLRKNIDVGDYYIDEKYFNDTMYRFEVCPFDFLVSCSGANYGAIYQMPNHIEKGIINQALLRIRLNNDLIDNRYFDYYFSHHLVNKIIGKKGDSTIPNFPPVSVLKKLEIKIHSSVEDQQKIAKVLSDLDAKIELNNKINTELEAMAKTLYDYWFVQFDFPNPSTSSGQVGKPYKTSGGKMVWNDELKREIPEGWEVKSISEFIDVKDGTHDSPKPKEEGYKLITSKNLKVEGLDFENSNFISEEDYISINKRSKVETGDILFSMIGNIGTIYKVEETDINFAVKNVAIYKTSQNKEFKNFVYMYLRSIDMDRYMKNVISGSIQKFIGLGSLRNTPFLFNETLIQEFSNKTKSIFDKLQNSKEENQQLASLRDWLLPMLMNGQISVGEVEKEYQMKEEVLGMVAEPTIINLTPQDKKVRRKMLATFIVNQCLSDTSFGKTKFEKLLHLIEYHLVKNDFNQRYSVQTAGPYDGGFTKVFWDEVIAAKWFKFEELGNLKRIVAGENHEKSLKEYGFFSEHLKQSISEFISLFKNSNYEKPEIVSTLYAVWNNRLIKNELVNDALLKNDFIAWDKQKARYANGLDNALAWMRNEGITPDGWGKYISRAKNNKK